MIILCGTLAEARPPFEGKLVYSNVETVFDIKKGDLYKVPIFSAINPSHRPRNDMAHQVWGDRLYWAKFKKDSDSWDLYRYSFSQGTSNLIGVMPHKLRWVYQNDAIRVLENTNFDKKAPYYEGFGRNLTTYYVQIHDLVRPFLNTEEMHIKCSEPGYSYATGYVYYIDVNGGLNELNLIDGTRNVLVDLRRFIEEQNIKRPYKISIGPGSPDRKFIPLIVHDSLYIVSRDGGVEKAVGRFMGLFGNQVKEPLFWDRSSKYILFSTLFDWFPSFDFQASEIGYYSIDDGSVRKIESGRYNKGALYGWD